MNWYYVDAAGKQAGPVDDAGLDTLRVNGVINPETLIWQEGMTNWQPFREVKPGTGGSASLVASGIEEAVCAQCGGVFPLDETIRAGYQCRLRSHSLQAGPAASPTRAAMAPAAPCPDVTALSIVAGRPV